jgi:hypothetical protein
MKKTFTLLIFTISFFANAQYFEGFENGVPGTMTQTYAKGETTWINFGLSALDVEAPLSENNSAVFFNAMETKAVTTSLQTPILNLSDSKMCLEFKYLQRQKTENYANILTIELSNDGGQSWNEIAVYKETMKDMKTIHVDLAKYNPTYQSCIKFISTQLDANKGYPIVIDDISLKVATKQTTSIDANADIEIYPNPSTGLFTVSTFEPVQITVFDSNGRTVFTTNESKNNTVIDLSSFASGVYFAKINGNNNNEVKKLINK